MSRTDVPDRLQDLIQRCLHKDPSHRFTNIADIAKELEPWLVHESSVQRIERVASRAKLTPMPQRSAPTMLLPDRRRRRRRLWLVVPAVAALGLVVVGFVVALGRGRPDDASTKAPGTASVTLASAAPSVIPAPALVPSNDLAAPATAAVTAAFSAKGPPTTAPRARATRSSAPEPRRSPDPPADEDRFGTRK